MSTSTKRSSRETTRKLVLVGLFGSISALLMILEFGLPLIPGFIKMDFSELPVILGGFLLGPLYGSYIVFVKIALNFILNGTTTFGIGELVNMIGSLAYMLPAVFIYRKLHTKKGAIISLVVGTLIASGVLLLANYFVMFPLYAAVMNFPMEAIVKMAGATNPWVSDVFTMMLFSLLPFNLFKYGLTAVITFFTYKRLEKALPFR